MNTKRGAITIRTAESAETTSLCVRPPARRRRRRRSLPTPTPTPTRPSVRTAEKKSPAVAEVDDCRQRPLGLSPRPRRRSRWSGKTGFVRISGQPKGMPPCGKTRTRNRTRTHNRRSAARGDGFKITAIPTSRMRSPEKTSPAPTRRPRPRWKWKSRRDAGRESSRVPNDACSSSSARSIWRETRRGATRRTARRRRCQPPRPK